MKKFILLNRYADGKENAYILAVDEIVKVEPIYGGSKIWSHLGKSWVYTEVQETPEEVFAKLEQVLK